MKQACAQHCPGRLALQLQLLPLPGPRLAYTCPPAGSAGGGGQPGAMGTPWELVARLPATHLRGTISWQWGGPRILHSCQALPGSTAPTSSGHRAGRQGRAATPFPEGQRKEARPVRRFCVITPILKTGVGRHWPRSCRHAWVKHGNGLGSMRWAPRQAYAPPHLIL